MLEFLPAVKSSLRYKWSICGAVICSLLIALLWGASISTIYPFVEIVLEGNTAESWLAERLQESRLRLNGFADEIQSLTTEAESLSADPERRVEAEKLMARCDLLAAKREREEKTLAWTEWVQPFVQRHAPKTPFGTLLWAVGWLLATSIIKGVLLVISAILVARVANRTARDLRRVYYRQALEMDQRRIEAFGTANLMTHLSHNMQMVSGGLQVFYGKMIREPLKMIACLVLAAWISWPLLLLSMLVVPAGAGAIRSLSRRMKRATQREVDGMGAVFQSLIETFGAIKTVRVFNQEATERKRFKRIADSLCRMSTRISLYDSLLRPITEVLGIISIAISIIAGAYLVLNRETSIFGLQFSSDPLKPSSLLLFYSLLAGASDPGRKMSEVVNNLVRGGMACTNLEKAFSSVPTVGIPEHPLPMPVHSKSIRFDRVSFAYQPRQPVIKQVSFEIPFGQCVAIVGANGCGKSTLANLLLRFYDPHQGKIEIDGVDIRSVHPRKLRRQLAWVTQDAALFRTTVWNNIAYGKRKATECEIMRAAQLACVDRFVDQLPEGYQTQVGDDGKLLSAGQRQRIALARAILADPRILILDEATSNLDGKSEALIHDHLREFMRSRTTLLITHRAQSLQLADRVLVMEAGKVVVDCPREEAAGRSPEFQGLFARSA
ncbi:MAG: ABC transporter ATP-binding protein [Planctomycetota bacterium]